MSQPLKDPPPVASRASPVRKGPLKGTPHNPKAGETWVKDQDELFITFYRERLQKAAFDKKALTLDPLLGGHKLTAKEPARALGTIKLPAKEPGIRLRSTK